MSDPVNAPPKATSSPPDNATDAADEVIPEDPEADRVPLRGLHPVQAPVDLTRTVPELIRRRSAGRFFGRKRLSDRLPLEWLSLGMLILLAAVYAALKLLSTN
jgi:hypothetical protein